MQRVVPTLGDLEQRPLAADVQKLARIIAVWATARPIVRDVALFGERILAGHAPSTPVEIAVRFDDSRKIEGFDDWIEQLRTRFAELEAALGEHVIVYTPEMVPAWRAAFLDREVRALANEKVRIIVAKSLPADAAPLAPANRPRTAGLAKLWSLLPLILNLPSRGPAR